MLDEFWNSVAKYIANNKNNPFPSPFKYKEMNILSYDLILLLWKEHCNCIMINEMFEKECDYNRLLRMENKEIREELIESKLLSSKDDGDESNNNDETTSDYLS